LDADVIVFCTGYSHDVRGEAIKVVGPEIGERLDDYWELDDEGELRGAYKPHGCKFVPCSPFCLAWLYALTFCPALQTLVSGILVGA
jgi:hypothetical protein